MLDVGFFIWKLTSMPKDPMVLVGICKKFGIKRLAIKVLEKFYKYNVPNGDKPFLAYVKVLRDNGIEVEGWGYHYPDQPGLQSDAIEERRDKLELNTYHLNAEKEWQAEFGMPKAVKAIVEKVKDKGFELLLCSYRYPSQHKLFPFDIFMVQERMDGASPQVYWALAHNPVNQLAQCLLEYSKYNKPVYPIGPTFGASFKIKVGEVDKWIYWEPSLEELIDYRTAVVKAGIDRLYYYSLDWVLAKKRFDMLEAATGVNNGEPFPPPPDPIEKEYYTVVNCKYLNGRSESIVTPDNILVSVRQGLQVKNLKQPNDQWEKVSLDRIVCWMHGDYLD